MINESLRKETKKERRPNVLTEQLCISLDFEWVSTEQYYVYNGSVTGVKVTLYLISDNL